MWPDGKRFAFTIFDDTDNMTMRNGPPVYDFLDGLGFRTTKSVWPLKGKETPSIGGTTCENPQYLYWVQGLQEQGFEVALHNVMYHTATRPDIIRGVERFKDYFGHYPATHTNHAGCEDSLYWGDERLTGVTRLAYNILTKFQNYRRFRGHIEQSEFFWGDVCKETIKYVRNFTYFATNTFNVCPAMPYFDEAHPQVNNWFASSEGQTVESFNQRLSEENQDRLENEGGLCIIYTHFSNGFVKGKRLNPRFRGLMERLAQKDGWFVPVSTVLDYLLKIRGDTSYRP
jgi:hypothetical protein